MDLHGGINSSVITHRPLKLRLFSWDEKYEYETDVLSNVKMLKVNFTLSMSFFSMPPRLNHSFVEESQLHKF